MIRNFLLASSAAVALLSPLAAVKSDAHEYYHGHHHRHCYKVFYRSGCDSPWCFVGEYHSYSWAERVAEGYRCRGFEVFVR